MYHNKLFHVFCNSYMICSSLEAVFHCPFSFSFIYLFRLLFYIVTVVPMSGKCEKSGNTNKMVTKKPLKQLIATYAFPYDKKSYIGHNCVCVHVSMIQSNVNKIRAHSSLHLALLPFLPDIICSTCTVLHCAVMQNSDTINYWICTWGPQKKL